MRVAASLLSASLALQLPSSLGMWGAPWQPLSPRARLLPLPHSCFCLVLGDKGMATWQDTGLSLAPAARLGTSLSVPQERLRASCLAFSSSRMTRPGKCCWRDSEITHTRNNAESNTFCSFTY